MYNTKRYKNNIRRSFGQMGKKKVNANILLGIFAIVIILVLVFVGIYNSGNHLKITGVKDTYKYNADNIYVKGRTKPRTKVKLIADDGYVYDKTKSDNDGNFKITVEDLDEETAGKYYIKVVKGDKKIKKNFKVINGTEGKAYLSAQDDDDDLDYSDEDTDYDDEDVDSESEPFNAADYQTGVTYDQLARTPDDYKNKKVALSGEVIQVIEDDGVTEMRLAVNGDYDNVVLADITDSKRGDSHILENDNVTIYGYSAGTTSYESTMGSDITVPYVLLEKVQY